MAIIRRAPLTSAAIVASLALGIGASASVFSLMNGLVLRPVPVPHPERLVTITSDSARRMGFLSGLGWNVPMWSRLRDHAGEFGGETVFHDLHLDLASSGERQIVSGVLTSGSFFDTVGVGAQAGRTYGPADDRRGGGPEGPVAVISDAFWARRWSRSTGAVGSTLRIEDVPFTIVGVTPGRSRASRSDAASTWRALPSAPRIDSGDAAATESREPCCSRPSCG